MIAVTRLRVERDALILKAIDWTVAHGEHWVILGANGSGKTSLLSTLTGYMPLTTGAIAVLGETYGRSDWRELRKRIGIVSSSIHQLMEGHETALSSVISGRHAMIGMWGEIRDDERRAGAQDSAAGRGRKYSRSPVALSLARRTPARADRTRADGAAGTADSRRAVRRTRPGRARTFRAVPRTARAIEAAAPTLVLVTHHVEEIMPAFSHVLVLKDGAVLAAGPKAKMLTSATLSRAFDAPLRLRRRRGRYALAVTPSLNVVL